MSVFKFNFSNSEDGIDNRDYQEQSWHEAQEILPRKSLDNKKELLKHAKMFISGDIEIGYVFNTIQLGDIVEDIHSDAEKSHSDLITAKYEGGLKIWECTYDLIEYLEKHETINFKDKEVLDLGCGAGILGIYALLIGGKVTFQDYNKEIIENVTIPNVILNTEENECPSTIETCRFFSGDWAFFEKLENTKFDIILSSETIYNVSNYEKLVSLFKKRLNDKGIVLLAAKTCYFGVGGSIREFESVVSKADLISEIVWKNVDGIQREILKIHKN